MNLNDKISRDPAIIHSDLDGKLMMMNIDSGVYYSINEVGATIWKMIEEPLLVSEICSRMGELHDVAQDVCERDVLAFLEDALTRKMVVCHSG